MSQNKNIFNDVAPEKVRKSTFDMGNTHVTSCNFGEMIPVYVEPTLPGSHWRMSHEWLIKASATLAPIMHRNQVYIHTFYVPYRNLWENWINFITETKVGGVLPAVPYLTMGASQAPDPELVGRLANYMGVPFGQSVDNPENDVNVQAFWFAAYQFIWNEYYRDQNLQTEVDYELIDGNNNANTDLLILRLRAWMHDYFTSALPDTQKGDAVNIPMVFEDVEVLINNSAPSVEDFTTSAPPPVPRASTGVNPNFTADNNFLFAETSELLGNASIIDLRTAEQLQKFRETMMTHGSRYNEFLQAIYGYKINDDTIQRPVYLGGMRADLVVSETLATTANAAADQPQGAKSGNLNSYSKGGDISYLCPEHGVIMSILTIMPDSMYFQGFRKEFTKLDDPFEFGNPLMANIGEQQVLNNELYGYRTLPFTTFGYQMRYAEYKQTFNRISSDMTGSLLFWNEARNFSAAPVLNSDFIECDVANDDLNRIFNVEDTAVMKLWVMIRTNAHVSQPLPYFGTPALG